MPWVEEALSKGELKITENNSCPFCNPDVETKLNADEKHKWVSKKWYEGWHEWYENRFKKGQ